MSFLARIAHQARTAAASDRVVARPKGLLPEMPAPAPPVDRPASGEHPISQTEPSAVAPKAAIPTAIEPPDEPPPARSVHHPDGPPRPDQSELDQKLATVAGPAGARLGGVEEADLDPPEPPAVVDVETEGAGASGGRDQDPEIRIEATDQNPVAPPADEQQGGSATTPPVKLAEEPVPMLSEFSPGEASRHQPAEPSPTDPHIGRPNPDISEAETEQAVLPTDQAVAATDGDGGAPPTQSSPVQQREDGADRRRPEPLPIFEPVHAPQPEQQGPAPSMRLPAPDQPPLLQIDQIDVVVTDPVPTQPAVRTRARLAAVSASRRYLRRL